MRRSAKRAAQYRFHLDHAAQAKGVLRLLEEKYGRTDPAHLKLADTYARDVFGDAIYAPWLRVYTAFSGAFKEGWIPDNYYACVVVPHMKGGYGKISNLKPMSRLIFDGDVLPDIAYFANGLFFTDKSVVVPERELEDIVFEHTGRVVFKLDGSMQGNGIHIFDRTNFNPEVIRSLGNGVIQRFIIQHRLFDAFASKPVATLRFTTVVDDAGRISVRACFLRLGRADDTHVLVDREICVPVRLATGELCAEGYMRDWGATEAHPDSGVRFAGVKLPAFAQCVATVLNLHRKIPFVRCVGWDVTVDVDGHVQVMEWNGEHNDVKFSEATQGPCFLDLNWERLQAVP
ncbi:sugar-transfer associated ATP-grasp domain-containing protein [Paraburkholderia susongensis]|uniref:Sugar-transfer associated ATP-grasp n=1 Tax=Paraburkholderia susongensis TaxID=1515439 RepID=A0A1X7M165_9BURK|nr:sugar-transfer associated ATP-grasp domain-containing protein [Paraburkholderia susongensis]SMG59908.1 Sugar-transfer associated ATP-grasp [Paraburkholderia susongensis]